MNTKAARAAGIISSAGLVISAIASVMGSSYRSIKKFSLKKIMAIVFVLIA